MAAPADASGGTGRWEEEMQLARDGWQGRERVIGRPASGGASGADTSRAQCGAPADD